MDYYMPGWWCGLIGLSIVVLFITSVLIVGRVMDIVMRDRINYCLRGRKSPIQYSNCKSPKCMDCKKIYVCPVAEKYNVNKCSMYKK